VKRRIGQFSRCFVEAVMVVVLVAWLLMDWRSALVVAMAIPLTIALTLAAMGLFAVPLHQISIAALIIALGMLVDDPVVASDGINRELAQGRPHDVAAWLGPWRLRRPIFFGTIINIVAFLPLVLLPGDKGAFIWGLPMVVTCALVASRLVSMTFVPLLGFYVLRGQKGLEAGGELRRSGFLRPWDRALMAILPRYQNALEAAIRRPVRTLVIAYGLLALSLGLTPFLGQQFFPPAERNQLLIDVELPEAASITQTREVCADVANILKRQPEIETAAIFSGGTAPRFYYNVEPREPGGFLAQVLVNTARADQVPPLLARLRDELDRDLAGARCVVKQLEQGPPVQSPIQVRLTGENLDDLRRLADAVSRALREAGAYKVHDNLGRRMPSLEIAIDQERANSLGISNAQIGRLAQAAFHGLPVTELRDGDHLIPVIIRLRAEERNEAAKIRTLYVRSAHNQIVPLDNFASVQLKPEYATIAHFNQLRAVTVNAFSMVDELPSRVLGRARPTIAALPLPPGARIAFAGEDRELARSRREMAEVMALSLSLTALAMVIQFRSVVKSAVVMLTVPLGLIGALLGLTVLRAPFGFMALLGIVSLAGVIVSHIIVLSDFIEEARAAGRPWAEALVQAGLVRLRAVLVTVFATVGGLVPLTVSGGELWQPLTAVHIFGLLLATALTLLVLPTLYYLFATRLRLIR
jgi:multidrug efflux pump subunit AcrB